MYDSFTSLKTRPIWDKSSINCISKLEENFGLKIPPFLYLFYNTFEFSEQNKKWEYYLEEKGHLSQFATSHNNSFEPRVFEHYRDLPEAFKYYESSANLSSEITKDKHWILGGGTLGSGLYVPLFGDEVDRIFVYDHQKNESQKLNETIFDFIHDYKFNRFTNLEIRYDDLIRLWTEKFWRYRDEIDLKVKDDFRYFQYFPKAGFDFIFPRLRQSDELKRALENKSKIALPFKLSIFFQYFKFIGKEGIKLEKINLNGKAKVFENAFFTSSQNKTHKIFIKKLWDDETIIEFFQKKNNSDYGFLKIGEMKSGDDLLVRLTGNDKDKIYLRSVKNETRILCEDIFNFVRGLFPEYDSTIQFEKLYLKWGEQAWKYL